MSLPHLPAEIHNIISSHLERHDLSSYRSASRILASIGAQYLFKHLTFHASYTSLGHLKSIGNNEHLARLVESITWDVSSMNLDACDVNEWRSRFLSLRPQELCALRPRRRENIPSDSTSEEYMNWHFQEMFERYENLVAQEQKVLALLLADIKNILAPFVKLKTIIMEKRRYELDEARIHSKLLEPHYAKMVERGMLYRPFRVPYKHSTDMLPLVAALNATQSSSRHFKALTLHPSIFSHIEYSEHLAHVQVSQITRLHLRFALRDPSSDQMESSLNIMNCKHILSQGHLREFLQKFQNLQSLSLDFEARSLGNGRAPVNLHDVFPPKQDFVWPRLQELAIYHADTPASTVTALLSSHAETLRSLALGDLCLDPPASWEFILTNLQPTLSLSSATFSHFLFDARVESFVRGRSAMLGWCCDEEDAEGMGEEGASSLGPRLAEFMVRGGICPLREERKITRVVGLLDNRRLG